MNNNVEYLACLEIEAALESLVNLTLFLEEDEDDIATEAAATDTERVLYAKDAASEKLIKSWLGKFEAWGRKVFDKPVAVPVDFDELTISDKIESILKNFDNDDWNDENYEKYVSSIEKDLKALNKQLKHQKRYVGRVPKDRVIVKKGLFKNIRNKMSLRAQKFTYKPQRTKYANALKYQIQVTNKIMELLDDLAKSMDDPNVSNTTRDNVKNSMELLSKVEKAHGDELKNKRMEFIVKRNLTQNYKIDRFNRRMAAIINPIGHYTEWLSGYHRDKYRDAYTNREIAERYGLDVDAEKKYLDSF